tara:strand:+ start:2168 stop:2638 length:471 start_codon:yes stop_codon:yes gene_type:complete
MSVGAQAFYRITQKIKDELVANVNVNTVTYGDITKIDLSKQTIFPLAHVIINNVSQLERVLSFNITVLTMDVVDFSKDATTDIFLDNSNEQDVLNTQLAVANRMVEKLRSSTLYLDKFQLDGSASCEPFVDRFENELAGWATTFTVLVQNDIDNEV